MSDAPTLYIYIYIYITRGDQYPSISTHISVLKIHMIYVYIYIYIYVRIYIYIYIYIYMTRGDESIYLYAYQCTQNIYTHKNIYIYTHTNTHTDRELIRHVITTVYLHTHTSSIYWTITWEKEKKKGPVYTTHTNSLPPYTHKQCHTQTHSNVIMTVYLHTHTQCHTHTQPQTYTHKHTQPRHLDGLRSGPVPGGRFNRRRRERAISLASDSC